MAEIWAEQLERFKIPAAMYGDLINRCMDFRRKQLRNGDQMTAFSVELFVSVYEIYLVSRPSQDFDTRYQEYLANGRT